jgi:hypothetical protein
MKDISIMAKDSTFATGPKNDDLYVLYGIEEVRILDIPEPVEPTESKDEVKPHPDIELITFDF